MPETDKKTCFVIMPFSKDLQPVYERIYEPVIMSCHLTPVRVDGIFRAGLITKDIYDGIQSASVVLADLTGANPNVYYELGIAHRERKPVILTAQDIDRDIRFDVKTLRVIEYKRGADDFWNDKLREDLTKAIKATLDEPLSAIATPWLGPVSPKQDQVGAPNPVEVELKQILDVVTSLYSMSSRQLDGESDRLRRLEGELAMWRARAEEFSTYRLRADEMSTYIHQLQKDRDTLMMQLETAIQRLAAAEQRASEASLQLKPDFVPLKKKPTQ